MSGVVKNVCFFAKFSTLLKISWFWPISFFAGFEWSKISFWAKFWTWLKISGFCQFSSFTGPEWTKLAILIQILTGTKNYRILPNFILHVSWVVENVSFELNFRQESKFVNFAKIASFTGQKWSNSRFQAKFSTRLKISGFCQVSSFAGLKWSKISFSQVLMILKFVCHFWHLTLCFKRKFSKLSLNVLYSRFTPLTRPFFKFSTEL